MLSAPRSAGVSVNRRPPWRRSVAASDPVAGVNGARGRLRLSSPPDAVAAWLSAAAVWTRSRGERDHRISEAQPRSGGRRERARVGELGIWKPGILPRVRGLPRLPGFQIFSSSPRRRPRRARPAGGGGRVRAATWRTGNLEPWESARRGAGRVDAGPPLPGVPAWGALGRRPWPRRTRARTVTDQPSLLARIDRAIYRLQNTRPPGTRFGASAPQVPTRRCLTSVRHSGNPSFLRNASYRGSPLSGFISHALMKSQRYGSRAS